MDWAKDFLNFIEKVTEPLTPDVTPEAMEREVAALQSLAAAANLPFSAREIGKSRDGEKLWGLKIGRGDCPISLTAGAHSDEPAGPKTALLLARWLLSSALGQELLEKQSWFICPHVNPDGARRNARWVSQAPELESYARHAFREPPGEDVEFLYPGGQSATIPPRPENEAVAAFLRDDAPFRVHGSLHGMAFAEGAWWLIEKSWADRTVALRSRLKSHFESLNLGYHDIDRRGEKGFFRLEPGFATTPTSIAMREFFLNAGDPATAGLFRPNSMEFVQSLGGNPLSFVSEIPLFRLLPNEPLPNPPGPDTPFQRFRPRFQTARQSFLETNNASTLHALSDEFQITPVPWKTQVKAIGCGVLETAGEVI